MGGDDGPPPPQVAVVRKSRITPSNAAHVAAGFSLPVLSHNPAARQASIAAKSQISRRPTPRGAPRPERETGAIAGMEFTCTLSVSVTLPLAGKDGEAGVKLQANPDGRLGHCNVIVPLAPFCELSETVKFADCPTATAAEVGKTLPVKPGDVEVTCTISLADAVFVNGPAVPAIVKR